MAGSGQVSLRFLALLVSIIPMLILSSSLSQVEAREFDVGGKQGWVPNPSEDYNRWASKNRFQVNDTLNFKYNNDSDSVLLVTKEDYDSCNTNNPIQKFNGGHSIFELNNSGFFYFISGNAVNCKDGEKLIVRVLGTGRHPPVPVPAPAPRPGPGTSAPAPAPAPSGSARIGVSVGFGIGVVFMFAGFAGLV